MIRPPLLAHAALPLLALLLSGGCAPEPGARGAGAVEATEDPGFQTVFAAPAGRALTVEDYYAIRSVGGVELSPDGTWVLFSVSLRLEEGNATRREAWIVPTGGGTAPYHVLHGGDEVRGTGWTEDGLFHYDAAGATWTLDVEDENARPVRATLDDPPTGLSPDGRWVATLEEVEAPPPPEPAISDFEQRHEARFEGVQFDWLNFQRDGAPFPAPDPTAAPPREVVLRPAAGGEPRPLTDLGLRPGGLTWHPASGLLAFTADEAWKDERSYSRSDLFTVSTEGEVNRLTDDGYTYGGLGFSPDGRYLSYTTGYGTDMIIEQRLDHGGPRDLYVRELASGEALNLTADWPYDPGGPRWSPDGAYLYFTAGIGGTTQLFRVTPQGGEVEQVTQGQRRHGGLSFDRDFTTIAYTVGLLETPSDVYAADIDGSNERKLTDVHADVAREITFSRAERLLYTSADGTPVEGWLLYPYGYDPEAGPYPMIVHSHGGPHSASGYGFNFKHQLFAANGYFVLQTNFRSSTGYGDDFKWATWGAWGDKDGADVMAGVDYAIAHFAVDPSRVGSIGHSYGGFMTNWLITQYPDRFAAAVAGAGISNWVSDYGTADIARTKETEFFGSPWMPEARDRMMRQSPLSYADRVVAPTLFVHGEVDQRVPYEEAEQMYVALKKNGVPAKVIQYAGQSHGIGGHWNNVHRMINELRWFDTYLKGMETQEP